MEPKQRMHHQRAHQAPMVPHLNNLGIDIESRGFVKLPRLLDELAPPEAANALAAMARNVGSMTVSRTVHDEFERELLRFIKRQDVSAEHLLTVGQALLDEFSCHHERPDAHDLAQRICRVIAALPKQVADSIENSYPWLMQLQATGVHASPVGSPPSSWA